VQLPTLKLEQSTKQDKFPPENPSVTQVLPFKFKPSQTSPDSIVPLPQTGLEMHEPFEQT